MIIYDYIMILRLKLILSFQAYEWALEAMKHAASLRTDGCLGVEELETMLSSLTQYLETHPPINASVFTEMLSIAQRLCNDKLQEQCQMAQSRCNETFHLLKVRHATLRKAKDQIQLERSSSRTSIRNSFSTSNERSHLRLSESDSTADDAVVLRRRESQRWDQSRLAHSPMDNLLSVLRRRSYAGKPSTPMYSPVAAAFKENIRDMNLLEYEEYLFSEGLITEDMSDRIVAFLPKGLSDSTLKGSRESVRSSVDNISGSKDNVDADSEKSPQPSISSATSTASPQMPSPSNVSFLDNSELALRLGLSQQRKGLMRKSHSLVVPSTSSGRLESDRKSTWKAFSLLTASTESLPW